MNRYRFPIHPTRVLGLAVALGLALASTVSAHPEGHILTQPQYGGMPQPTHPMPQMPGQ